MAEAVGVSHVTLLNHFGSKENLITEVIDRLRPQTIPEAAEAPIPEGLVVNGAELLKIWLGLFQNFVARAGCPPDEIDVTAT